MSCESHRECGYRKVGGLYLVSDPGSIAQCDRLPLPIVPCSTCGEQPRFHRSISQIDPQTLWGDHVIVGIAPVVPGQNGGSRPEGLPDSTDFFQLCPESDAICSPTDRGWLMWVGSEYTRESFRTEAKSQGVSKRIPAIPNDLVLGEDWVYLAKKRLIPNAGQMWLPGEAREQSGCGPAIFQTCRAERVEKIVTYLAPEATVDELRGQGVTPVVVDHGDPAHR